MASYAEKLRDTSKFTCSKCGGVFDNSLRYPKRRQCKPCCKAVTDLWKAQNPERCRAYTREFYRKDPQRAHKHKLSNRYGMTIGDYDAVLLSQGGVCAICKLPETRIDPSSGRVQMLSVDHDHTTGENRGLLCNSCNRGIGIFCDNAETLRSAALYLDQFQPSELKAGVS